MKGAVFGLTFATTKAHFLRAALESIAYQIKDLVDVMAHATGGSLKNIAADGGPTKNKFLMQFQADMLGKPVHRPSNVESTALGAAYLAGLATGFWKDINEIKALPDEDGREFVPQMSDEEREQKLKGWHKAVKYSFGWAKED